MLALSKKNLTISEKFQKMKGDPQRPPDGENTDNIHYRYSAFNIPSSLQNNDWNLLDKVSELCTKT